MNLSIFSVRWLLRGIFAILMIGLLASAGTARAQFLVEFDGAPGDGEVTLSLSGSATMGSDGGSNRIIHATLSNFINGTDRTVRSTEISGICTVEAHGTTPERRLTLTDVVVVINQAVPGNDILSIEFSGTSQVFSSGLETACSASAKLAIDIDDIVDPLDITTTASSHFDPGSLRIRNLSSLPPGVTMTPDNLQPVNGETIGVGVEFSQSVTGFTQSDVLATNGAITNFSGTGALYSFDLTPDGLEAVLLNIPANAAANTGGTGNAAADQVSLQWSDDPIIIIGVPVLEISSPETGDLSNGDTDTHTGALAGRAKTVTYTVTNSGPVELSITDIVLSAAMNIDGTETVTPDMLTVAPGASETFAVTYTPTDVDDYSLAIALTSNDTLNPNFGVTVSGTAGDGDAPTGYSVEIDQDSINRSNDNAVSFTFANAEVGATYEYSFRSSNESGTTGVRSGVIGSADQQVTGQDLVSHADGTITLTVTLTDTNGNKGDAVTDTVTKDTFEPSGYTVSIDQDPIDQSNQDAVSFTFADAEVTSNYNYEFKSSGGSAVVSDSGPITAADQTISGIDLSSLSDGTITLTVTLTDTAGNPGADAEHTSTKVTTEPEIGLFTAANAALADGATDTQSNVVGGVEETITYTVNNTGNGTLNVTNIAASSLTNIDGTVAISPTRLDVASSSSSTFTVTYTPDSLGAFSFDLDLASNDSDETNYDLTVSGTAADGDAPTGHSVEIYPIWINQNNQGNISIIFEDAETNVRYDYTLTSSNGGPTVVGTGTVIETNQTISNIDLSSLLDGEITLSVILTDANGNDSVPEGDGVTKDTIAPVLTEITGVPSPANVSAPEYVFSSDETGDISYAGACSSAAARARAATITITFNTLADGTYDNCSLTVTDAAGNDSDALSVSPFTIDTSAPTLAEVTPVASLGMDPTPDYVFSSSKAGTIAYAGACASAATAATIRSHSARSLTAPMTIVA